MGIFGNVMLLMGAIHMLADSPHGPEAQSFERGLGVSPKSCKP